MYRPYNVSGKKRFLPMQLVLGFTLCQFVIFFQKKKKKLLLNEEIFELLTSLLETSKYTN